MAETVVAYVPNPNAADCVYNPSQGLEVQLTSLNSAWAANEKTSHPTLFADLGAHQYPRILWIGCSDSRVPETSLLGLNPGEVFTHRNIANLWNPNDIALPAVIDYAVGEKQVQHIIVCGHTNCGGCAAACGSLTGFKAIDDWLVPLRQVASDHASILNPITVAANKQAALAKLSVQRTIRYIKAVDSVQTAWKGPNGITVHGAIYHPDTGLLEWLDDSAQAEPPIDPATATTFDPGFYYHVTNRSTPGHYFDIQGGRVDGNGGGGGPGLPNQYWKFVPVGDGSFTLHTMYFGDGVVADMFSASNDANPWMVPSTGSLSQRWRVTASDVPGYWYITNDWFNAARLDVMSASDGRPRMTPISAGFFDQHWRLDKLVPVPGYVAPAATVPAQTAPMK